MFVETDKSRLHYIIAGGGPQALLLFHGFGQDHKAFESLVHILGDRYTLYSFDLYFHGLSEWEWDELPLEKPFWKETIHQFLKQNSLQTFSLAGFSMGGKFALATLEAFPHQTKEIFLLAPDGIKTSFWYTLATYPIALRKLFKSIIQHPKRFHCIVNTLQKLQMLNKQLGKFAEHQMNTEEKRKRVYHSWVVFRHLNFKISEISRLINQHNIDTTVLVGKHDSVIKPSQMNSFLRKLDHYQFEIIDTGHNGLLSRSGEYFKRN